jgi:hypothetical protein
MIIYPYEFYVADTIISFSFEVPNELVSVFTEQDKTEEKEDQDGEIYSRWVYKAPVSLIRERLEIMGFSAAVTTSELESFVNTQIKQLEALLAGTSDTLFAKRWKRQLRVLRNATPSRWIEALTRLIGEQWVNSGFIHRRLSSLERCLFDDKLQLVQIPFSDMRLFLRACLDLFYDSESVKFDFTSAEDEFGLTYDAEIVNTAVDELRLPAKALEKILVLTEGKADSRLLRRSLSILLPHVTHLYSFLDHSTFRVPGGTGEIERLARGLAGADVGNKVIVLFDNDTAGTSAAARLQKANLPKNFRVLSLPHLDIAESYPTLGPTGLIETDINGKACGIELYCGLSALKTAATAALVPIQWTGYDSQRQQYQGEILDKEGIQTRFLRLLEQTPNPQSNPDFRHMLAVLRLINDAFQ